MIYRFNVARSAVLSNNSLATALRMLLRARLYAQREQCNPWQFAVELEEFRYAGISRTELRWMLLNELVEHAQEVLDWNSSRRKFKQLPKHIVPADACFILSDLGLSHLVNREPGGSSKRNGRLGVELSENLKVHLDTCTETVIPEWDGAQKLLSLNGVLVKRYRFPAPNQEVVLAAFQEEQWVRRIDDPLRPVSEQDSRRRLNDTIKCLNRKQTHPLIAFCGDGTGTGVVWQLRTGLAEVLRPQ